MSSTKRDVSPPTDVWRALLRMFAALVGLVMLSLGVVWLIDGGAARWPSFLSRAALLVVPAGFLLAGWQRLHQAAGRRVVNRTSWSERDKPQYAWRIEAAIVGAVLSLIAVGTAIGMVVIAVDAYQRFGWTEVEAQYVALESRDPVDCGGNDYLECHRLITDDDVEVFVPTAAKSWPADDELRGEQLTVYAAAEDLAEARAESPTELIVWSLLLLAVGIVVAAGAWTVLAENAGKPDPP